MGASTTYFLSRLVGCIWLYNTLVFSYPQLRSSYPNCSRHKSYNLFMKARANQNKKCEVGIFGYNRRKIKLWVLFTSSQINAFCPM